MAKKNSIAVYDFEHLRRRYQHYAAFAFESISTLIHKHLDFYELILITSGEFLHTLEDNTHVFPAGSILLFKPGITHQLFTEPFHSTHFVMCVEQSYFETRVQQLFPKFDLNGFDSFLAKSIGKHSLKYIEHLGRELCQDPTLNINLAEEVLYLELSFLATSNDTMNLDIYTSDIIQKLNNQLYMNTAVKDIYAHYPCSSNALLQHFKERTGISITEYRTQTKLHYACQLLIETDMKIFDVATALQYESLSHFFRTFKAHMKMTPTQYRKQYTKKSRQENF